MSAADRLLCIDLQVDPQRGLQPDANAIFGARALLSVARRSGWTIAHTRMRSHPGGPTGFGETRISGMRPLMSEKVFLRSGRSIADSPGLLALLDEWRHETVYVAAFDHVTLLSCLLLRYESGPRMVLVENALSAGTSVATRAALDAFRSAASHLAAGSTTIHKILSRSENRIAPLHQQSA
ncbi:MAG: isochorismatase family protein [Alphaproteobacteria bacterium]|nr:isochorismatase family protein [Alphaproteobacteria bacterium]